MIFRLPARPPRRGIVPHGGAGLLLAALLAGGVWGCGGGIAGDGLRGQVRLDGSSTLFPVAEAVSEEFQRLHPRVMVSAGLSGTGGGLERFCRGETDVATASRRIRPDEIARCRAAGIDYLEVPVAIDGLSVLVNPLNTFVDCLTVEELRSIWRPGSTVRTWRDVRPEFPSEEISLYGPGTHSGTFDYFTDAIVGEAGASRADYQASEDDNVLVQGIVGDRYALGYFGFAYQAENRDKLKLLAVDGGAGCRLPTDETLREGTYRPLGRLLYLYPGRASLERPEVRAFLDFFMTHAGELVPTTGYLPLPPASYQDNLRTIGGAGSPRGAGGP